MVFIIIWKVAKEFVRPKNITVGSNNSSGLGMPLFIHLLVWCECYCIPNECRIWWTEYIHWASRWFVVSAVRHFDSSLSIGWLAYNSVQVVVYHFSSLWRSWLCRGSSILRLCLFSGVLPQIYAFLSSLSSWGELIVWEVWQGHLGVIQLRGPI